MSFGVAATYVPSRGGVGTRNIDALTETVQFRPQALTVYVRFVERGTITLTAGFPRIFQIGTVAIVGDTCFFRVFNNNDRFYRVQLGTSGATTNSTLTAAPDVSDMVELAAQLYADGAVQLHQSVNGGTVTSATKSGANALRSDWTNTTLAIGSRNGDNAGAIGATHILIRRGVLPLVKMRRYAVGGRG